MTLGLGVAVAVPLLLSPGLDFGVEVLSRPLGAQSLGAEPSGTDPAAELDLESGGSFGVGLTELGSALELPELGGGLAMTFDFASRFFGVGLMELGSALRTACEGAEDSLGMVLMGLGGGAAMAAAVGSFGMVLRGLGSGPGVLSLGLLVDMSQETWLPSPRGSSPCACPANKAVAEAASPLPQGAAVASGFCLTT